MKSFKIGIVFMNFETCLSSINILNSKLIPLKTAFKLCNLQISTFYLLGINTWTKKYYQRDCFLRYGKNYNDQLSQDIRILMNKFDQDHKYFELFEDKISNYSATI